MGRASRKHRERRKAKEEQCNESQTEQLEEKIRQLAGGDAIFWSSPDCPADVRRESLEAILAFESVGTGQSLFEGLQEHGIDLPHPDKLNEQQCADKAEQVILALFELQIILVGFEKMSPRELYSTLWHQTLWEGCYVDKRLPGAATIIDVSHSLPRSEVLKRLESLKAPRIQ